MCIRDRFSTLHTNDSLGGISRLVDMGVEPFLVSAAVRAFLAQRLVRKLCPHCRVPVEITDEQRQRLKIPHLEGQAYEAFPDGCDKCRNSGFAGRLAIYEVSLLTEEMQDLIIKGANGNVLKEQAVKDGYVPMRDYGWYKVMTGITTVEEVVSATAVDLGGE